MLTPSPDSRETPAGGANSSSIRTRYDLPGRALSLADARLVVANANLAAYLGGQMVLVRPRGISSAIAEQSSNLLAWLGVDWVDTTLDEMAVSAELKRAARALGGTVGEPRHLLRLVQDQALGITHAVIHTDDGDITAIAERAAETFGWHAIHYVPMGPMATLSDGTPTSMEWYRERGYLPEALQTHLAASACWATPPSDPDVAQMQARYRDGQLSRAIWQPSSEQLHSAGRRAMREATPERVVQLLRPRLERAYGQWHQAAGTAHPPENWLAILAGALQQEAACLEGAVALARFAFANRVGTMTSEASATLEDRYADIVLASCLQRLRPSEVATPEHAKLFFRELRHHYRDTRGLHGRQVMYPIRAALTGTMIGPCLGVVASLLGYERCRRRLREALDALQAEVRDQA